jgi:hypothetical protein
VLPVRDARVLFALRPKDYVGVAETQTAQPHEFFCPMNTLIDCRPADACAAAGLDGRAALAANIMELPGEAAANAA